MPNLAATRVSLLSLVSLASLLALSCLACSSSSSGTTDDAGAGTDSRVVDGAPVDTAKPLTCSDLTCPTYLCTCNDGSKMQGSGCLDAVCNSGADECGVICSSSGGVRSVKELPSADAGPPPADSGPTCGKLGDACGDCVATNCCPEMSACAGDKACQTAAACVSLKCTGNWDKCATECDTTGNAAFKAYSACVVAKGCAATCKP